MTGNGNGKANGRLHVVQEPLSTVGQDYVNAEDLRRTADELIAANTAAFGHLRNYNLAFLFRKGTPTGMKNGDGDVQIHTIAKAFKANPLVEALTGFHAGIWVWEWWWEKFAEPKRQALTMHELCHLSENNASIKLEKHDLEDFAMVVGRYGRWFEGVELYAGQLELFDRNTAAAR